MTHTKTDVNKLVEVYIRLRDEIASIQTEADTKTEGLKKQMQRIEEELHKLLAGHGMKSLSCDYGTVFVTEQSSAKVADWSALIDYVKENNAYHLLNHAVNKSAVRDFIDENQTIPPGVDYIRRLNIQVRRK